MKDKKLAKDANRVEMIRGSEELIIGLDEHVTSTVNSLNRISTRIDLALTASRS